MLTDVPEINQQIYKKLCQFVMRNGGNIVIIGPSGAGKTEIPLSVAEEENCKLVYINMSVLERIDFQGFPVVSDDKKIVTYAAPEFIKFIDSNISQEMSVLTKLTQIINDEHKDLNKFLNDRILELSELEKINLIYDAEKYITNKSAKTYLNKLKKKSNKKEQKYVFLFDEVDKAATETTQTLLEILQFGSINGRKLNVQACILTGNLPDEHAHTNEISHAITKRCKTYRMNINFNQWVRWAKENSINEDVISFLISNPEFLYKKAPDGDPTAYALPSPRTWVYAAKDIDLLEKDNLELNEKSLIKLKRSIIAGYVGESAASKFETWNEYYKNLTPVAEHIILNGPTSDINNSSFTSQQLMTIAYIVTARTYDMLRPDNNAEVIKTCFKNVYSWLNLINDEVKIASVRSAFNGDFKKCQEYKLVEIPEFKKVFIDLNNRINKNAN